MDLQLKRLGELVDRSQASGRYVLTRESALQDLGGSKESLKKAVQRLVAKRRLVVPKRGFYVVVPLEYRVAAAPPPSWFIDDLMRSVDQPYYVGLLAAAALHGAGHQQPQELQVLTPVQMRTIRAGRGRIRFFVKKSAGRIPTVTMNTPTGRMRVSTPEATAIDLMRYVPLDAAVTAVAELHELLRAPQLVEAAERDAHVPSIQRLGSLLQRLEADSRVLAGLAQWLAARPHRNVRLRPDRPRAGSALDRTWRVWINEVVEPDDL